MKRKFTILTAALLLLTMIHLPGKAVGQTRGSITINRNAVTDFPSGNSITYGYYHWSDGDIEGTINCANGQNNDLQFNYSATGTTNGRNAQHVANTVVVPGSITSITMTTRTGSRNWTVYVGSSALTTSNYSTNGTSLGSKSVGTSGTTWSTDASNGYNYFYLAYSTGSACYISSIVIEYEVYSGPILSSLTCSGTPAITTYEVGDYFVSTGLTVTANYSDDTHVNVTSDVVWTPAPLTLGTTQVTGTYSGQTVTVSGITVTAASDSDIVLNKDNSPFSSTSTSNTNIETVTLDGIEYQNYGGYIYSDYLSFNRNINGYLGNNTVLCGNIKKIVVSFSTATAYSCFTMYEGAEALAETTTVTANPKTSGSTYTATYMFSRNNGYFKYKLTTTGNFCNINSISIYLEDCANPAITVSPNSLTGFTYVEGNGPSGAQTFTVSGEYLTANLNMSLGDNSDFEMCLTENGSYTNTLALTPTAGTVTSTTVYARLKASKTKGNYNGTITLTSTDATDKTISLSGTVTGQTYTLSDESGEHGSITFDPSTPVEAGTHVTLTANPASDDYYFNGTWSFFKEDFTEVTSSIVFVSGETNVIEMPAYNLLVDAAFVQKPIHTTTCTVTGSGTVTAAPASTYEGQTVTLTISPTEGFYLSNISATYVDGNSDTQTLTLNSSGNTRTFTMPNYDVTVTATFLSNIFEGNFVLFTGAMTEGDYILVYNGGAMNNIVSSSRFGITNVTESNIISSPSKDIVWHIAPSATVNDYWTIYNAKETKYVNAGASSTTVSLVDNPNNNSQAQWGVSNDNNKYSFRCKANESNTARYLGRNDDFGFANYQDTYGVNLTLYKYTVLTPVTITFNGNGGTYNNATTYTQTVYDGIATPLDLNQFAKSGFAFAGWSTTQNGEVVYVDGASITFSSDITLYAQWNPTYTATVDNQIVGGIVKIVDGTAEGATSIEAAENTEITLTYTANSGHAFEAWNVYKVGDATTTVTVENNKFNMPAYNVTISATFVEVTTYSLVTNVNQIVSGKHYIIASGTNGSVKAMGTQNSNNRAAVTVSASNGLIQETEGVFEFIINGPEIITKNNEEVEVYTIYDANYNTTGGYLHAATSGNNNNYLKTRQFNSDANSQWTIDINTGTNIGQATIKAQGNYTKNLMRYNDGSSLFSCYASASNQNDIYLYVKDNDTDYHFYKDIAAASNWSTESVGWYFIASPLASDYTPTGSMLENNYDLYQLNNTKWENYKVGEGNNANPEFDLVNGRGYLYANSANVTLHFSGAINTFTTEGNANQKSLTTGWNLIGNPYNIPIYINKPYYKMKADGSGIETEDGITSKAIPACTGVVINAGANETVTFSTTAPSGANSNQGNIQMSVAQQATNRGTASTLDNAIVSFNEGSQLEKFYFGTQNANLYIPQNNEEYAIVSSEAQGEMPVSFRANENGQYTLTVNAENVEMNYLHLIDNMTGADIDLLQTPSYTFNAKTTDYESRFRLVFAANNEDGSSTGSETFSFYSNGNWVINNEGDATLQVIDALGRILSNESISGTVSKSIDAPAGVYVLRLINGENVKTQKIVVR